MEAAKRWALPSPLALDLSFACGSTANPGVAAITKPLVTKPTVTKPKVLNTTGPPSEAHTHQSGFEPDPFWIRFRTIGGVINFAELGLPPECVGFSGSTPDAAIVWASSESSAPLLRLSLPTEGTTPRWSCSAPTGLVDATTIWSGKIRRVDVMPAPAGSYQVWDYISSVWG